MSTSRRLLVATLAVLLCGTDGWTLTRTERRCQDALAGAGRQLLSRSTALLAACRRGVARGKLAPGTDCLSEAGTSAKRAAIAAKATRRIRQSCPVAPAASLRPGGDCANARTPDALVGCLQGSHDADAATLIAAADATQGPLPDAVRRCQDAASSETRSFLLARLGAIQQCKRHPPKDLTPGIPCADAPRTAARIAILRSNAVDKITARCTGAALTGASFGAPCTTPATGTDLGNCLLDVAVAAGDDALAAQFHDTSFCGDASDAVEKRIDDLLSQMTLADKIAQMHGVALTGLSHTTVDAAHGIPGLAMVDGPRGVGVTLGQATAFPVGAARGATWDPALETRVGEAVGTEVRAKGADMILAPTINLLRHPRWGRAQETYGEDTVHLGTMGVAYVRGAQQHVIANPKHYALNSIEDTRFNVDVTVDERTLREIYLPHFRRAVQEGHAASVMSAYNKVNGTYCGENAHLLNEVLKGDWGFQGFVESDWVFGTRSTTAPNAGLDIEMPIPLKFNTLEQAVQNGDVSQATIDAAVRRILRGQFCFHLDTDPPVVDPSQVETQAHKDLARDVAREAIVLLKNAGGALPIDRNTVGSVVVVGTLATSANLGDVGSSNVIPMASVSPLAGLQAAAGAATVTYVAGPTFSPEEQTAISSAGAVVVVVGLDSRDEGEGLITPGDREGLVLPRDQDQVVTDVAALNARTIVLLEGSGGVTMPWLPDVEGVVMAWYPGEQGGTAIADVLYGDVNPSGKLPVVFASAENDLPPFDNVSLAVTYDYYYGYRYLDRHAIAPLFPFGFGLSYTTFQYANLTITPATVGAYGRVRVTADVTNAGTVAGDEVVQLYVGYQGSSVDRPVRELKAFARVHLGPGETKTVPLDVRAGDVAYWDSASAAFVAEPITYDVAVGSSSQDLPLTGTFAITP